MFRSEKFFLALLLGLSLTCLKAQKGIPYITHFDTREGYEAQNWDICQDDHNAMLFANKKGLLRYDGNDWTLVQVPYLPLKIKQNPSTNKVYILSKHNVGLLNRDKRGKESYQALSYDGEISADLSNIIFTDTSIIVYGEKLINIYQADGSVLMASFQEEEESFSGIIVSPKNIFVNISGKGLFAIDHKNLIYSEINNLSNETILFSLPYDDENCLLGTANGELYLFNGLSFKEYALSNSGYLIDNSLSDGLVLNDSTYVFSSLYGGVILVNKMDGEIQYTLNYENGLPDDEIYAMSADKNNGLWLTYEFGSCRVDAGLPVRTYNNYPGLEGLLTNAVWYHGELYVSTTEGLYYLSEVKNYEEIEVYFKKKTIIEPVIKKSEIEIDPPETKIDPSETKNDPLIDKEDNKKKKRFLSGIFKRKKHTETPSNSNPKTTIEESKLPIEEPKITIEEPKITVEKPTRKPQYEKRKVSKLKSIEHIFKPIKGINSRCNYLYASNEGIMAGASSGLYIISDHKAEQLLVSRNIHSIISSDTINKQLICGEEGLFTCERIENDWRLNKIASTINEAIFSALTLESNIWASGYDVVYALKKTENDSLIVQSYNFESIYPDELYLNTVNDTLFLFSSSAIRYYDKSSDSFILYDIGRFRANQFTTLEYFPSTPGNIWIKLDQEMIQFHGAKGVNNNLSNIWGLFQNINSYFMDLEHGCWLIDNYTKIFRIDPECNISNPHGFQLFIESVKNEAGDFFDWKALTLAPAERLIRINVSAPYYLQNKATEYQYIVDGRMENWSKWNSNSIIDFYTDLGVNTIRIRAKNILNEISETITISFEVQTPFYKTTWIYLLLIPLVLGFFFLILYMRERKLRKDKRILEEKVQERTIEIQKQKQQIEIQKDDITSSITYASRIQHAILPEMKIFEKTFAQHMIFFRPRDIVSGDFYWISEIDNRVMFAAADCTGHGVPGAFMSMLGNSFLNEITKKNSEKRNAGEILDELRQMITDALSQSGKLHGAKDGMDIALCVFDKKKQSIEYSGAYNSLYMIRDGELHEFKANRMPIGYYPEEKKFSTQVIKTNKNDVFYLFSDGFIDQFGGPKGKKFTTKRFKQMLLKLSHTAMKDQEALFQNQLEDWQGITEQLDDILIMGIKV